MTWIEVQPTTMVSRGPRRFAAEGVVTDAELPIVGETSFTGPVFIAWDAAREDARHPERGHNVVYHEFAHQLDMDDGTVDGTPVLDPSERQRWIEVCTTVYEAVRDGRAGELLDPYAGVNPGEFFAVATEVFFDRPVDLEHHHRRPLRRAARLLPPGSGGPGPTAGLTLPTGPGCPLAVAAGYHAPVVDRGPRQVLRLGPTSAPCPAPGPAGPGCDWFGRSPPSRRNPKPFLLTPPVARGHRRPPIRVPGPPRATDPPQPLPPLAVNPSEMRSP